MFEFKLATLSAVNQTKSIPLSLMLLLGFTLLTTVSAKLIITDSCKSLSLVGIHNISYGPTEESHHSTLENINLFLGAQLPYTLFIEQAALE